MSLDKEQLQALLADYVEGSLSERQIDEAEAYLAANPGVRTVVDRLMIDSEALRALPRQRASIDFSEDFRGQAERDLLLGDASPPARPSRAFGGPMLALAALLMVGLGLGGAGYYLLAYRPATNLDFASVAAEGALGDKSATTTTTTAAPARARRASEAATTDPAAAATMTPPSDDNDGKAWDRAFAPAVAAAPAAATPTVAAPTMAAPAASIMPSAPPESAPMTASSAMAKDAPASRPALPDDMRVALDARRRGAVVIVVDDVGALAATRQRVNAALAEQTSIGGATSDRVIGSAAPGGLGVGGSVGGGVALTTAPIAHDVPAAAIARLRSSLGATPGVALYDVAPPPSPMAAAPDGDSVASKAASVSRERVADAARAGAVENGAAQADATTVDVYVVARPSSTTRPADAP